MYCPKCSDKETKVIDSRLLSDGDSIRRRRKCESCGHRFTTHENYQIQMPVVSKEDGRIENYDREKILKGLKKACQKRAISIHQIELILDQIERDLIETHLQEIPSALIGEQIMIKLHQLDPVAYVRFASFYWDFKDIEGFIKTLSNTQRLTTENFYE